MSIHLDYAQTGELIKNIDNVYILTHQSPDGDTIGSGFALYYALTDMGKNAKVLCSDKFHKRYDFITQNYNDTDFQPE